MSNYVFLIDQNKTPLLPIHPAKAREFLVSRYLVDFFFPNFPIDLV